MVDHSKPTLSSTYPDFLAEVKGRLEDISRQFDPATGERSGVPTSAIRWTSSARRWEVWTGTSWVVLANEYAISVSGSAQTLKTPRYLSFGAGVTADAVPFDGSGNVEFNVTGIAPSLLTEPVPINKGGTGAATAEGARTALGLGSAATANLTALASAQHTHSWSAIEEKPTAFHPAAHGHSWGEISGKPGSFPPSSHAHSWGQISGVPATATRWPTWGEVSGKPSSIDAPARFSVGTHAFVAVRAASIPSNNHSSTSHVNAGSIVSGGVIFSTHYYEGQLTVGNPATLPGTWVIVDRNLMRSRTPQGAQSGSSLALRVA